MMLLIPELEVQQITLSSNGFGYEHIIAISGISPPWHRTKVEAIADILEGRCRYYVVGVTPGTKVYVDVVKPNPFLPDTWYLKTFPDGLLENNLLSLPRSLGGLMSATYQNALADALKRNGR